MNSQQRGRLDFILSYLDSVEFASVKELSDKLGVTEMTVRRDIEILRNNGMIRQLHGAITRSIDQSGFKIKENSYDIMQIRSIKEQEKERIGKEAVRMISPGSIIFIDIGTTAAAIAKAIPAKSDITAACFSMNVFNELVKKNLQGIYLAGGFYHPDTQAFESDESVSSIQNIRANTAFIVPSGISMDMGLTAMTPYEARIKRMMTENADRRVLVADSSKFSSIRACFISSFERIDAVVTDRGLSGEWIEFIKASGTELHLC